MALDIVEKITLKRADGFKASESVIEITSLDDVINYVRAASPLKSDTEDRLLTFNRNYVSVDLYKETIVFYADEIVKTAKKQGVQQGVHWAERNSYVSTYNQHPITQTMREHFGFYIMDKLQFASDIKKYLDEHFDSKTDAVSFDASCNDLPIAFSGWETKRHQLPFKSYMTSVRNILYRYIGHNETVVDKNLNQIWPMATGKPPVALVELLNKTTEISR